MMNFKNFEFKGVLCYESLVGQAPFHAVSDEDTIENILKTSYKIPTTVNRLARDFIAKVNLKTIFFSLC